MNYNPEIWNDLTYEEKKTYRIYEAFQKRTKKIGMMNIWLPSASAKGVNRDEYPADKIRNSKNWSYFRDVYEMTADYPDFDEETFMDSVFRNLNTGEKIFPARLRTKRIIENYLDYRMKMKMSNKVSNSKKMMIDLANTYKYIKRKLKKDELEYSDLYSFFNDSSDGGLLSVGIVSCIQEMISPFYLSISKSFSAAYKSLDKDVQEEIMSVNSLYNIRSLVKLKPEVYGFAKKLFKEDVI